MNNNQITNLLALAAGQHSVFALRQAVILGISERQIQVAIDRGWIVRVRRGVFAVAGAPRSPLLPLMAAQLAAGERAVVSCTPAGVLHRFTGVAPGAVELSTPESHRIRLEGVITHRTATLKKSDVQLIQGLRVTSPIRTLIDLAPRFGAHLLGEMIDEGTIARLWTPEKIAARYAQLGSGQPASPLADLLLLRQDEGKFRSRFEQRVYRVLKPVVGPFETNHVEVLDGVPIEMDLAWCEDKIDGEVDGFRVRRDSRTKYLRQCERENILMRHGWCIVRFAYEMDDQTIIDQIAPLLAARTRR